MEIADDAIGLNFKCDVCAQTKAHTRPFPKESATKVSNIDKKIKKVCFDNGREFVNKDWIEHAAQRGTILETTAPYSAQQNGIAERLNQTLTKKAQAMLLKSNAPKFLWSKAIAYACYLKNCVPTQVHGTFWKTPYKAFWGIKPNVNTLRPWGSKCYVLNQGGDLSKLDPKTTTAIFVGISDVQGKSWRYYKSGSNRILHSRNVTFPSHARIKEVNNGKPEPGELVAPPAEGEMTQANSAAQRPIENTRTGGAHVDSEEIKIKKLEHTGIKTKPLSNESTSNKPTQPIQQSLNQPVVPKPTTVRNNPVMRTGNNSISNSTLQTINAPEGNVSTGARTRSRNPNPTHVSSNENVAESGLNSPTTLRQTSLTPQACTPTAPTYLNLSKSTSTKSDTTLATPGDVEHKWAYAAKLSAPNNHPTVAEALAGPDAEEWQKAMAKEVSTFKKMDTYNLTDLPPGHKAIGNAWVFTLKRNADGTPARYKGQLVAQGFSQRPAGRMWNKLYNTKLKSLGYLPCLTDACVYKRMVNTEAKLLHKFDMQDLGNIHHFLGIAIVQNRKSGTIHLNQKTYIENLAIIAGLDNAYPADTPISPTTQLTQYKGTKPKFNYGTLALGLTYRRSTNDFGEIGYSDADWGSNLLNSKKQATVALSTMEAKYMLLSHACTQALWMRQLFEELNFTTDDPTLILSDNLAALALSAKSQFHGQSKHMIFDTTSCKT
ncbi:Reverse transcriptase (RNA-dependent DNA polymerase) [Rhizoctonia solani]|uniref:Reverse transcriptase (RNA-dependent DNA polymerase) n=1 Tax=Rhizoctonia solani TaxID=456999 RepID=A0A8H7I232_9AGAM|nr:Reverse transcriptase (RNA-dependent DNA polymerase) [Rhizoctonia solani]